MVLSRKRQNSAIPLGLKSTRLGSHSAQTVKLFASVYVRSANDSNVDLPIIVSEEDEIEKYGLLPGYVKRRKDQGGGYLANVEVLHHLHCLVLRNKTVFPNTFQSGS